MEKTKPIVNSSENTIR